MHHLRVYGCTTCGYRRSAGVPVALVAVATVAWQGLCGEGRVRCRKDEQFEHR